MRGHVLGVGGSNHDFSAAIVTDGRLAVAIEDERLQRIKRGRTAWHAEPGRDAVEYCLNATGITLDDLDGTFCCDDLERPTSWLDWSRVTFVNHHTAHAAAAYYPFPFTKSTLLVIDGHGSPLGDEGGAHEVETISTGWADGGALFLQPLQTGKQRKTSSSWRYVTQNSIGWFYKIVSMALGFGSAGEGKAMGLAAYGTPDLLDALRQFVSIESDGRFVFDPYAGIWDWLNGALVGPEGAMKARADLAYAAQEILVEAVIAAAHEAYKRAPSDVLGFGGGCALNTLANSRILEETPFRRLCVFPASGDNGLAVGAAFYGAHALLGAPRAPATDGWRGKMVYVGREYRDDEVDAAIAGAPVLVTRPADLVATAAEILAENRTLAMFRGRSEIGPRALGHRSLLALPGPSWVRDHINLNIKQRESFRPLAPMVSLEHASTYFEGIEESPHMLLVGNVRRQFRERLAAVTHVDGTARIQTVRAEDDPFLHQLLRLMGRINGLPVLLNTSLNGPGEPIVETPSHALALFVERPIDVLVIEDRLVRKYTPWVPVGALASAVSRVDQAITNPGDADD